jgi:hypothetical protein
MDGFVTDIAQKDDEDDEGTELNLDVYPIFYSLFRN